ncbi:retrovirus-related pol polyprotein from transposon TNT 1-94 [Tanacetum coccineum]|uniref:Retrovirus-related pol polyprotein from transposon TNT 1-94 n=1 Tax=Tanacetum coccineum TaxID=301880 RepID=A0ABQ5HBL8_9ASTR
MIFLSSVYCLKFPPTNNQLRTSSNPRTQATIQNGQVMVQNVQGRQSQGYTGNAGNNQASGAQCTTKKRMKDSEWFKEKMLLAQAQEAGVVLNEADHVDAYDSDCDDEATTNAIFMANLSPVGSLNDDTVEPLYDSDILFEVPHYDTYYDSDMLNSNIQELGYIENIVSNNESYDELTGNSNVISYTDYMLTIGNDEDNYVPLPVQKNDMMLSVIEQMKSQVEKCNMVNQESKSVNESLTNELERYKDIVGVLEYAVKDSHSEQEAYLSHELYTAISDRNRKIGSWEQSDIKGDFKKDVIQFSKNLKETSKLFEKGFIAEVKEMKDIFEQMEDEVDQCSVAKKCFKIEKKQLLLNNDRLLEENIASDIIHFTLATTKIIEKCTKVLAPGLLKIESEPINAYFKNNRVVHRDYLKFTKEHVATLQELLEESRALKLLDEHIGHASKFVERIQNYKYCNANVKNVALSKNSDTIFLSCNECLFSANHDACVVQYLKKMQKCKVAKSVKQEVKSEWKPTGRIFRTVGLGHNLFSVGQFYDSGLEVAFRKHTCFVRNLEGVDLLSGSRGYNLYTISMADMMKSSPICLLSKASKMKSWLWHRRLSHLDFGTINKLAKQGLVKGLPKLKYTKDHLCLACQMGKARRNLIHTSWKQVQMRNFKCCIWIYFLRTKDEALEIIIKFLRQAQVSLKATVRYLPTDNGTKFLNQTLQNYTEDVGITHHTSTARTPQQNSIFKRHNRMLVEAARTMLIFFKSPLFLWAEVVATACYTQNRSLIHTRYNKTPYELLRDRKPKLKYLHIFGSLCYPTNDFEDIGKL